MVAHVAWSVAVKSMCNTLVRSLIILHELLKQSQSYDGILSHRDVILSQYPADRGRRFCLNFAETAGVSDACAVCKRISSMKALQLGRWLVKSTNFHWSIFETEIWAFPHKETACMSMFRTSATLWAT